MLTLLVPGVGMGGSGTAVTPPDMPGLEHHVEDNRLHHHARDNRSHFHVEDNRLHYFVEDDDI